MGDRCTGHCCRRLMLPFGIDHLRANPTRYLDGQQIADMLIPIEAVVMPLPWAPHWHRRMYQYRCRHVTDAGDCAIYEDRPEMCRGYPYKHKGQRDEKGRFCRSRCGMDGCTHPDAAPGDPWASQPGVQITALPHIGRGRLNILAP